MTKKLAVLLAIVVAAFTIAVVVKSLAYRAQADRGEQPASPPERAVAQAPAARPPPQATSPLPPASAPATPPPRAAAVDDDALMARLRGLAGHDPEQILRLAREANARDPSGPHAAERAWMAVKSLTDLQRFAEAQDEARTMVNRYPGTSWAMDVQRHLLSNPL